MNKVEIISLLHLILKLPCVTDETQILCLFSMFYFFYKHTNYLLVTQMHLEVFPSSLTM